MCRIESQFKMKLELKKEGKSPDVSEGQSGGSITTDAHNKMRQYFWVIFLNNQSVLKILIIYWSLIQVKIKIETS